MVDRVPKGSPFDFDPEDSMSSPNGGSYTEPARGHLAYRRMPIEKESPEELGYDKIKYNLAESSFTDGMWSDFEVDLSDLVLCYGDHLGNPQLRELIAAQGPGLSDHDVLVTPGAAAALFIVNTSLLRPGDHVIVAHPNYVTNVETPRAIGAQLELLPSVLEDRWRVDVEKLAQKMRPETRLVSLTSPHNPTGSVMPEEDLRRVLDLVEDRGCYLLFDETYRDLSFEEPPPLAAALSERAISISSLSKAYGLPGLRVGWLICRGQDIMETFLAAKEQIFICGSVVDEALGYHCLKAREKLLAQIKPRVYAGFETVREWVEETEYVEWVPPSGGAVCFPRIGSGVEVDLDRFYDVLIHEYGTLVGPGHWFEMDRRYMRVGFGWPSAEELEQGLQSISSALEEATVSHELPRR